MAAALSEAKPRQLQVARLRQEEEESWISSEELHTDGSSDEECAKGSGRSLHSPLPASQLVLSAQNFGLGAKSSCRSFPRTTPPAAASEPATQDAPHLAETTRRLNEWGLKESSATAASRCMGAHREDRRQDEMEEQEDIMLWRPKRGSLKLPHIDLSRLQLSQSDTCADAPKTAPILETCDGSLAIRCSAGASSHTKKAHTRVSEGQEYDCKDDIKSTDAVQGYQPQGLGDNSVEALKEVQSSEVDIGNQEGDDGGT